MGEINVLSHTVEPIRVFLSDYGLSCEFQLTKHGYVRVVATATNSHAVGLIEAKQLRSEFAANHIVRIKTTFERDAALARGGHKTSLWSFSGKVPSLRDKKAQQKSDGLLRDSSGRIRPV